MQSQLSRQLDKLHRYAARPKCLRCAKPLQNEAASPAKKQQRAPGRYQVGRPKTPVPNLRRGKQLRFGSWRSFSQEATSKKETKESGRPASPPLGSRAGKAQAKRDLHSRPVLNLLRFLEAHFDKQRLHLNRLYVLKRQKYEEYFEKALHSDKYYRLFLLEKNGEASHEALLDFQGPAKTSTLKQSVLSPKSGRRKLNALGPFRRKRKFGNEWLAILEDKRRSNLLSKLKDNSPRENFHLYNENADVRDEFDRRCRDLKEGTLDGKDMSFQRLLQRSERSNSSGELQRRKANLRRNPYIGSVVRVNQESDEENYQNIFLDNQKKPWRKTCSTVHNPMFNFGSRPVQQKIEKGGDSDPEGSPRRQSHLRDGTHPVMPGAMPGAMVGTLEKPDHVGNLENENQALYRRNMMTQTSRPTSAEASIVKQHNMQRLREMDWDLTEIGQYVSIARVEAGVLTNRDPQVADSTNLEGLLEESKRVIENCTDAERAIEQQDVKLLFQKIDLEPAQRKRLGILSLAEVSLLYKQLKDDHLRGSLFSSLSHQDEVVRQAQTTLQVLALSLMLSGQYELMHESYKAKLAAKTNPSWPEKKQIAARMDPLIRILLRCRKLYEAKHEVVRILLREKKRLKLIESLEEKQASLSEAEVRAHYLAILKLCWKEFNQIERLRKDNPLLNRPFITQKENLQSRLVKLMADLREHPLMKEQRVSFLRRLELDATAWRQKDERGWQ